MKMPIHQILCRVIACSTAASLLFNWLSLPYAEANLWLERRQYSQKMSEPSPQTVSWKSLAVPIQESDLALPESLGTVTQSYRPGGEKSSFRVIHIQDAHDHYAAQRNLADILRVIQRNHNGGNTLLTCVEGAWDGVETGWLAAFPDDRARGLGAESLLKQSMISGEEYLAIASPGLIRIAGTEDPSLYRANLSAREGLGRDRKKILRRLEAIREKLRDLKGRRYPETLLRWDRLREDRIEGRIQAAQYLERSAEVLPRDLSQFEPYPNLSLMRELSRMERDIPRKQVESERNRLLTELQGRLSPEGLQALAAETVRYRMGKISHFDYFDALIRWAERSAIPAPMLRRYRDYLGKSAEIKIESVSSELDAWERNVSESLAARNAGAAEILPLDRLLERQIQFWSEQFAPSDWDGYVTRSEGQSVPERVRQAAALAYGGAAPAAAFSRSIDPNFERLKFLQEAYYRLAFKRDEVMAERAIEQARESGAERIVLIAGGFHTAGIVRHLREKGIGFDVVRPRLTRPAETQNPVRPASLTDLTETLNQYRQALVELRGEAQGREGGDIARLIDRALEVLTERLRLAGTMRKNGDEYLLGSYQADRSREVFLLKYARPAVVYAGNAEEGPVARMLRRASGMTAALSADQAVPLLLPALALSASNNTGIDSRISDPRAIQSILDGAETSADAAALSEALAPLAVSARVDGGVISLERADNADSPETQVSGRAGGTQKSRFRLPSFMRAGAPLSAGAFALTPMGIPLSPEHLPFLNVLTSGLGWFYGEIVLYLNYLIFIATPVTFIMMFQSWWLNRIDRKFKLGSTVNSDPGQREFHHSPLVRADYLLAHWDQLLAGGSLSEAKVLNILEIAKRIIDDTAMSPGILQDSANYAAMVGLFIDRIDKTHELISRKIEEDREVKDRDATLVRRAKFYHYDRQLVGYYAYLLHYRKALTYASGSRLMEGYYFDKNDQPKREAVMRVVRLAWGISQESVINNRNFNDEFHQLVESGNRIEPNLYPDPVNLEKALNERFQTWKSGPGRNASSNTIWWLTRKMFSRTLPAVILVGSTALSGFENNSVPSEIEFIQKAALGLIAGMAISWVFLVVAKIMNGHDFRKKARKYDAIVQKLGRLAPDAADLERLGISRSKDPLYDLELRELRSILDSHLKKKSPMADLIIISADSREKLERLKGHFYTADGKIRSPLLRSDVPVHFQLSEGNGTGSVFRNATDFIGKGAYRALNREGKYPQLEKSPDDLRVAILLANDRDVELEPSLLEDSHSTLGRQFGFNRPLNNLELALLTSYRSGKQLRDAGKGGWAVIETDHAYVGPIHLRGDTTMVTAWVSYETAQNHDIDHYMITSVDGRIAESSVGTVEQLYQRASRRVSFQHVLDPENPDRLQVMMSVGVVVFAFQYPGHQERLSQYLSGLWDVGGTHRPADAAIDLTLDMVAPWIIQGRARTPEDRKKKIVEYSARRGLTMPEGELIGSKPMLGQPLTPGEQDFLKRWYYRQAYGDEDAPFSFRSSIGHSRVRFSQDNHMRDVRPRVPEDELLPVPLAEAPAGPVAEVVHVIDDTITSAVSANRDLLEVWGGGFLQDFNAAIDRLLHGVHSADAETLRQHAAELQERLEELSGRYENLKREHDRVGTIIDNKDARIEDLGAEIYELRRELDEAQAAAAAAASAAVGAAPTSALPEVVPTRSRAGRTALPRGTKTVARDIFKQLVSGSRVNGGFNAEAFETGVLQSLEGKDAKAQERLLAASRPMAENYFKRLAAWAERFSEMDLSADMLRVGYLGVDETALEERLQYFADHAGALKSLGIRIGSSSVRPASFEKIRAQVAAYEAFNGIEPAQGEVRTENPAEKAADWLPKDKDQLARLALASAAYGLGARDASRGAESRARTLARTLGAFNSYADQARIAASDFTNAVLFSIPAKSQLKSFMETGSAIQEIVQENISSLEGLAPMQYLAAVAAVAAGGDAQAGGDAAIKILELAASNSGNWSEEEAVAAAATAVESAGHPDRAAYAAAVTRGLLSGLRLSRQNLKKVDFGPAWVQPPSPNGVSLTATLHKAAGHLSEGFFEPEDADSIQAASGLMTTFFDNVEKSAQIVSNKGNLRAASRAAAAFVFARRPSLAAKIRSPRAPPAPASGNSGGSRAKPRAPGAARLASLIIFLASIPFLMFHMPSPALAHEFVAQDSQLTAMVEPWSFENPGENTIWGISADIHAAINDPSLTVNDVMQRLLEVNPAVTDPNIVFTGQSLMVPSEYSTPDVIAKLTGVTPTNGGTVVPPFTPEPSPSPVSPTPTSPTPGSPTPTPASPTPSASVSPTPTPTASPIASPAASPAASPNGSPSATPTPVVIGAQERTDGSIAISRPQIISLGIAGLALLGAAFLIGRNSRKKTVPRAGARIENDNEQLQTARAQGHRILEEIDAAAEEEGRKESERQEELDDLRRQVQGLTGRLDEQERLVAEGKAREEEAASALAQANALAEQLGIQLAERDERIAGLAQNLEESEALARDQEGNAAAAARSVQGLRDELDEARREIENLQELGRNMVEEYVGLSSQMDRIRENSEELRIAAMRQSALAAGQGSHIAALTDDLNRHRAADAERAAKKAERSKRSSGPRGPRIQRVTLIDQPLFPTVNRENGAHTPLVAVVGGKVPQPMGEAVRDFSHNYLKNLALKEEAEREASKLLGRNVALDALDPRLSAWDKLEAETLSALPERAALLINLDLPVTFSWLRLISSAETRDELADRIGFFRSHGVSPTQQQVRNYQELAPIIALLNEAGMKITPAWIKFLGDPNHRVIFVSKVKYLREQEIPVTMEHIDHYQKIMGAVVFLNGIGIARDGSKWIKWVEFASELEIGARAALAEMRLAHPKRGLEWVRGHFPQMRGAIEELMSERLPINAKAIEQRLEVIAERTTNISNTGDIAAHGDVNALISEAHEAGSDLRMPAITIRYAGRDRSAAVTALPVPWFFSHEGRLQFGHAGLRRETVYIADQAPAEIDRAQLIRHEALKMILWQDRAMELSGRGSVSWDELSPEAKSDAVDALRNWQALNPDEAAVTARSIHVQVQETYPLPLIHIDEFRSAGKWGPAIRGAARSAAARAQKWQGAVQASVRQSAVSFAGALSFFSLMADAPRIYFGRGRKSYDQLSSATQNRLASEAGLSGVEAGFAEGGLLFAGSSLNPDSIERLAARGYLNESMRFEQASANIRNPRSWVTLAASPLLAANRTGRALLSIRNDSSSRSTLKAEDPVAAAAQILDVEPPAPQRGAVRNGWTPISDALLQLQAPVSDVREPALFLMDLRRYLKIEEAGDRVRETRIKALPSVLAALSESISDARAVDPARKISIGLLMNYDDDSAMVRSALEKIVQDLGLTPEDVAFMANRPEAAAEFARRSAARVLVLTPDAGDFDGFSTLSFSVAFQNLLVQGPAAARLYEELVDLSGVTFDGKTLKLPLLPLEPRLLNDGGRFETRVFEISA